MKFKRNAIYKSMAIAAVGLAIPAISLANIYLVKEGKVVATYTDDAVDYITFDDPTIGEIPTNYDKNTRSFYATSIYYGDNMLDDGYNYVLQLYDLPKNDSGILTMRR